MTPIVMSPLPVTRSSVSCTQYLRLQEVDSSSQFCCLYSIESSVSL